MSYLLLIIYLLLIVWLIKQSKFYHTNLFPSYLPIFIFITKFIGGIGVYLVYAKYYGERASGDIFKYFDDGNIIFSSIYENPLDYIKMVTGIGQDAPHLNKYYDTCSFWLKNFNYGLINDNRTVIRFNAIVRLISMGNIHIHTLFISFISFTGLWAIFKIFETHFKEQKWILLLVIFFFPSVYFWTSGILKEGILMFAFGMLLYHIYSITIHKINVKNILWIIFTTLLLLISKFYILVAALPGIMFIILIKCSGNKYFFSKLILVVLAFFTLSWFSEPLIGLSFPEIITNKQNDFITYINSLNYVGSKVDIPVLEPNLKSILINTPSAFFRTLFRPSIFEITNLMSLMAALENLFIILFLILTIFFFTTKNSKNTWLWFCLLFVGILFVLSGLTTPVLGALVRYKAPALPFLGIALLFFINFDSLNKIKNKRPF